MNREQHDSKDSPGWGNLQWGDTVLFGNSAQEWPEPFPQLRVQHRGTLFGG